MGAVRDWLSHNGSLRLANGVGGWQAATDVRAWEALGEVLLAITPHDPVTLAESQQWARSALEGQIPPALLDLGLERLGTPPISLDLLRAAGTPALVQRLAWRLWRQAPFEMARMAATLAQDATLAPALRRAWRAWDTPAARVDGRTKTDTLDE